MIRRTALQGLIVPVKKATVEIKKDTYVVTLFCNSKNISSKFDY